MTNNTSTINLTAGIAIVEKTLSKEKEKRITTAICRKLFATKMVANNFLGFVKSRFTISDLEGYF